MSDSLQDLKDRHLRWLLGEWFAWLFATLILSGEVFADDDTLSFLALGDSYTIGEGISSAGRWPLQLTLALRNNGLRVRAPTIIARTGWTADQLNRAIEQAPLTPPYDLVTVQIGVNNQFKGHTLEDFEQEFVAVLTQAERLAGQDEGQVVVVSIPDWGFTPFGTRWREAVGRSIDAYNQRIQTIATRRELTFINITDVSRAKPKDRRWVANDGLHSSARQYSAWVEQLAPVMAAALKTKTD